MFSSLTEYVITISYASFVGIVFMFIYLLVNSRMEKEVRRTFRGLLMYEMLEMVAYDWELYTAQWAEPTRLRITLSVIGYSVRPVLPLMLLILALRIPFRSRKTILYAIPAIINMLISATGFFSGIAFSYDENNIFVRGPLGYSSQITLMIYLVWILWVTFSNVSRRSKVEMVIVAADALLCVFAIVVEAAFSIRTFSRSSIVMATIFYFMYFQSNDYAIKMEESQAANLELKKISQIDALTGLLNKKAFIEIVEQVMKDRSETPGTIFFFDLDNFKGYNDTFGHLAGDELLKEIAGKLKALFRDSDYIGRFGGDEFYIYMDNVPYDTILSRADQLLKQLSIHDGRGRVNVTASMGIIYQDKKDSLSSGELLRLADIALYDAKRQGKNRYVIRSMS